MLAARPAPGLGAQRPGSVHSRIASRLAVGGSASDAPGARRARATTTMRAGGAPDSAPAPAPLGPGDTVLLIGVTGVTGR